MCGDIKLSVTVITYNQEKYIRQCLLSVLTQNIGWVYEVVVGDDGSTDGTIDILKELQRQYPSVLRVIFREQNIGHTSNYLETTKECRGEYIAHIDGDDLMLPSKLDRQIRYLDEHPECVLVHHQVDLIDEDGCKVGKTKTAKATVGDINALIVRDNIVNSSVMFRRNSLDDEFFNIPRSLMLHDWLAHLAKAQYGSICYIPEILGCYRVYEKSIMKSESRFRLYIALIRTLKIASRFKGVKKNKVDTGKSILYLERARYLLRKNDNKCVKKYLLAAYRYNGISYQLLRYLIKYKLSQIVKGSHFKSK